MPQKIQLVPMTVIRHYPQVPSSLESGFSIVEVMITIAIIGVVAAIAAPSLREYLMNARISTQAIELVSDISYARSESATRGRRITMCASNDNSTCLGVAASWASGRIIFLDSNGDGSRALAETLLRIGAPVSSDTTLTSNGFPNPFFVSFMPYGGLTPPIGGTFTVCAPQWPNGRVIALAATGRPTTSATACP